jgi:phage terminase large subunit-like protein
MTKLTPKQIARYQREPASFIEECLIDPITGKPFELLPAERAFIQHAFEIDQATGRLRYPEQIYATPRKGGKTGFAAMMMLTATLLYGGMYAEGFCCSNILNKVSAAFLPPSPKS